MSSEMKKAKRHLQTTKKMKEMLPRFFMRMMERRESDPVAWCMVGVPPELLKAFNVLWEWPENFGTLCAANMAAPRFIEVAEGEGYSPELCSYVTNTLGYCRLYLEHGEPPPETPPTGGMTRPSMMLGSGFACDPRWKWFQAVGTRYFKVPVYSSDPLSPPWDMDINDPRIKEHYLDLLRRDFQGQVNFLEEQTGKKLDTKALREILKLSQEALWYWREVLKMRSHVPSPMGSTDYFSAIIPQMYMVGEQEAVDFYREMYEEVKEKTKKREGIVDEEKYRLIWFGLPPWYNLGMFNYLEEHGAVVVYESTYNVGEWIDLDPDDPLEALVQRTWERTALMHRYGTETMPELCNPAVFGGFTGSRLLNELKEEYQLDGAIMHQTRSCRVMSFGQIHTRNRLSELGIPSLIFESDMADPRHWSDAQVKNRVHAFLETINKDSNS